jgi:hypothetical protein
MSIEDEARQMLVRQRQASMADADRQVRLRTPVVTEWALDLAQRIEQEGYVPLPMYEQIGPPHKTHRYAPTSITTVRSLGLSGWSLHSSWEEPGAEYPRNASATLTTNGQLWMYARSGAVASGLTTYRGVVTGVEEFFIVGPNPLLSELDVQREGTYRKVFGVFGVAALMSGNVKADSKASLSWTGLY